MQINSKHQQKK